MLRSCLIAFGLLKLPISSSGYCAFPFHLEVCPFILWPSLCFSYFFNFLNFQIIIGFDLVICYTLICFDFTKIALWLLLLEGSLGSMTFHSVTTMFIQFRSNVSTACKSELVLLFKIAHCGVFACSCDLILTTPDAIVLCLYFVSHLSVLRFVLRNY